jgi:hypothetical protein
MWLEHLSHEELGRLVTSAALVLIAVLQLVKPCCFWGISIYFRGTRASFDSRQRERLEQVLAARVDAEGDTDVYARHVGRFTIVMAALALVPAVPYILPYALSCLAIASSVLLSYLQFRRASERRVAPLVRRSPWRSLPPLAIVSTAICMAGTGVFAAYPQFRLGAAIVLVSTIALLAIAWRVAVAPAILIGNDSQLEYLVDEHVRFCRATNLVALACAPPTVFVGLAAATLPASAHFAGTVTAVVDAAFLVTMVVSLNPIRKRIRLA